MGHLLILWMFFHAHSFDGAILSTSRTSQCLDKRAQPLYGYYLYDYYHSHNLILGDIFSMHAPHFTSLEDILVVSRKHLKFPSGNPKFEQRHQDAHTSTFDRSFLLKSVKANCPFDIHMYVWMLPCLENLSCLNVIVNTRFSYASTELSMLMLYSMFMYCHFHREVSRCDAVCTCILILVTCLISSCSSSRVRFFYLLRFYCNAYESYNSSNEIAPSVTSCFFHHVLYQLLCRSYVCFRVFSFRYKAKQVVTFICNCGYYIYFLSTLWLISTSHLLHEFLLYKLAHINHGNILIQL